MHLAGSTIITGWAHTSNYTNSNRIFPYLWAATYSASFPNREQQAWRNTHFFGGFIWVVQLLSTNNLNFRDSLILRGRSGEISRIFRRFQYEKTFCCHHNRPIMVPLWRPAVRCTRVAFHYKIFVSTGRLAIVGALYAHLGNTVAYGNWPINKERFRSFCALSSNTQNILEVKEKFVEQGVSNTIRRGRGGLQILAIFPNAHTLPRRSKTNLLETCEVMFSFTSEMDWSLLSRTVESLLAITDAPSSCFSTSPSILSMRTVQVDWLDHTGWIMDCTAGERAADLQEQP